MIPANAQLVFKGKLYDTYQWEQEMFDGSFRTFEMLRRPYNGCVIAVVDNKILVLEQEQPGKAPFLSLPGGRCDNGEDPLIAAQRELLEETGYQSDDWELWTKIIPEEKIDWQIHTYIARHCKKTHEQTNDNGERIKLRFLSFDEFLLLSENEAFRNKDAITELLRIRLDTNKMLEFKQNLQGVVSG